MYNEVRVYAKESCGWSEKARSLLEKIHYIKNMPIHIKTVKVIVAGETPDWSFYLPSDKSSVADQERVRNYPLFPKIFLIRRNQYNEGISYEFLGGYDQLSEFGKI